MGSITTCLLEDFDDPLLKPERWSQLLASGDTDTVFLTWHYQSAWWKSFGRGELLLLVAKRAGKIVALTPLFTEAGMVFFVGSGGSDYLDFVGNIGDPEVLSALLKTAREQIPNFLGFRFYLIPDQSRTGRLLQGVSEKLGLVCFDEGSLPAPMLALDSQPETAHAAPRKKSLIRAENFFHRKGTIEVQHLQDGMDILPNLDEFFNQHVMRWKKTPYPSLFNDPAQRTFYKKLTRLAAQTGWLRFTRLDWEGRAIAFHFGFCYRGSYLWYKPSFAIDLAHQSPGQVLLRQLLLAAIEEDAKTFDFGLGDEAFKRRFATHINHVRTWGLYPHKAKR